MMYSGIDLHSNNSVVAVIDDGDRVVAQKRLPNDIGRTTGFLARWQDELAGVVVESTYNWYWLVDGLQDAGFDVHLANTAAIENYEGLKHSSDESDAITWRGPAATGHPADRSRSWRGRSASYATSRESACGWCSARTPCRGHRNILARKPVTI